MKIKRIYSLYAKIRVSIYNEKVENFAVISFQLLNDASRKKF